jgi:hypothetical protein
MTGVTQLRDFMTNFQEPLVEAAVLMEEMVDVGVPAFCFIHGFVRF